MRIALAIEYAGDGFCGWQSQSSGCGVQDVLERALGEIAGEMITTNAAGRTDAGVHATSQIVHFDTGKARPTSAWVRGVNTLLPATASVLWARPVADDFHARFTATARHYTYWMLVRAERPALLGRRVGWYHAPLDIEAMRIAAAQLAGTHDFSAFRAAECQAKSPIKTLNHVDVGVQGPLIRFDFSADAFLHHMLRNIVGSLIYVGANKHPPAWIAELLAARDRTRSAPTFAADGLYLVGADYPTRFDLPDTRRDVLLLH